MEFFVFQISGRAVSTASPSLLINGYIHLTNVQVLQEPKQMLDIKTTTHPCPGVLPLRITEKSL